MPIDVHVPGCPPRPEALMHGVLKLRKLVQDDPEMGWRERYDAVGTEEAPSDASRRPQMHLMPDATGLELLAQELGDASLGDRLLPRAGDARWSTRRRSARCSRTLRAKGYAFLASVHGVDYYPEEPRLGVIYELLDMSRVDRITVKLRVADRRARRRLGDAPTGRRPTTRSARSTTCSASSSTATPTCAGS